MPPAWRRFAAFLVWLFIAQIGWQFVVTIAALIVEYGQTGAVDLDAPVGSVEGVAIAVGSLLLLVELAHRGAAGRLYGARRQRSSGHGVALGAPRSE